MTKAACPWKVCPRRQEAVIDEGYGPFDIEPGMVLEVHGEFCAVIRLMPGPTGAVKWQGIYLTGQPIGETFTQTATATQRYTRVHFC